MPSGIAFGFDLSLQDLSSLQQRYRSCTPAEERILHQVIHDSSFFEQNGSVRLAPHYREALEALEDEALLRRSDAGEFEVLPDLVYLPDGPGYRCDQLSGVLHHLEEESVRDWLELLAGDGEGDEPVELVYRRMASEILTADEISQDNTGTSWVSVTDLSDGLTRDRESFYADLEVVESPYREDLLQGRLFPIWNDSGDLLGLIRAERLGNPSTDPDSGSDTAVETEEKDWDRSPFNASEQVKVTQILSDALPVRLTEEGDPHRFDLKEASRITDWSLGHVDFLTNLLVEQQFLIPADDRFYMSERYESWESGTVDLYPFATGLKPDSSADEAYELQCDFSFGGCLLSLLGDLESMDDGFTVEDVDSTVSDCDYVRSVLMSGQLPDDSLESAGRRLLDRSLDLLFRLGCLDRWQEDRVRYRLNDRGRALTDGKLGGLSIEEDLPLILQPDGQLMVPLERPVETFRHVNPFGLVVKVDRMIVYQIDDKSLVQALNEGWNASGFRRFLEENVRELPNPMEELFGDILEDVEDVAIEEVHHLLQFETGATAAKAMNILNNYNPSRVDETTIVLHSSTNEETIRRNLSRGGVRLGTDSDRGSYSPLLGP